MKSQLLGWRHLVNWGRTLGVGGIIVGIPLLVLGVINSNSIMTGAAEGDTTNVSMASVETILGAFGMITSLVATWRSTGQISPTDVTIQDAFKQLAVLALNTPLGANLLQRLKDEIAPGTGQPIAPTTDLKTPAEYFQLLEASIRLEVSKSLLK